jgi:hypothetical protein
VRGVRKKGDVAISLVREKNIFICVCLSGKLHPWVPTLCTHIIPLAATESQKGRRVVDYEHLYGENLRLVGRNALEESSESLPQR